MDRRGYGLLSGLDRSGTIMAMVITSLLPFRSCSLIAGSRYEVGSVSPFRGRTSVRGQGPSDIRFVFVRLIWVAIFDGEADSKVAESGMQDSRLFLVLSTSGALSRFMI